MRSGSGAGALRVICLGLSLSGLALAGSDVSAYAGGVGPVTPRNAWGIDVGMHFGSEVDQLDLAAEGGVDTKFVVGLSTRVRVAPRWAVEWGAYGVFEGYNTHLETHLYHEQWLTQLGAMYYLSGGERIAPYVSFGVGGGETCYSLQESGGGEVFDEVCIPEGNLYAGVGVEWLLFDDVPLVLGSELRALVNLRDPDEVPERPWIRSAAIVPSVIWDTHIKLRF